MSGLTPKDVEMVVDGLKRYQWLLEHGWKDKIGFESLTCAADLHDWVTAGLTIQKAKSV